MQTLRLKSYEFNNLDINVQGHRKFNILNHHGALPIRSIIIFTEFLIGFQIFEWLSLDETPSIWSVWFRVNEFAWKGVVSLRPGYGAAALPGIWGRSAAQEDLGLLYHPVK